MDNKTSLQRARTANKGKKIMEETMLGIEKRAEESEDRQFDFPLRWIKGECIEKSFVIFHYCPEIEVDLEGSNQEEDKCKPPLRRAQAQDPPAYVRGPGNCCNII